MFHTWDPNSWCQYHSWCQSARAECGVSAPGLGTGACSFPWGVGGLPDGSWFTAAALFFWETKASESHKEECHDVRRPANVIQCDPMCMSVLPGIPIAKDGLPSSQRWLRGSRRSWRRGAENCVGCGWGGQLAGGDGDGDGVRRHAEAEFSHTVSHTSSHYLHGVTMCCDVLRCVTCTQSSM